MRKLYLLLALGLALTTAAQAQTADQRHAKGITPRQATTDANQGAAQQPTAPATSSATQPSSAAPQSATMTRGTAEAQRLQFMVGTWKTAEKFEPSEFIPKACTGSGRAEIHAGQGHMFFIENYQSHNEAVGKFAGHAVMWYDPNEQQYKAFWCDSMGGCESTLGAGKWDGDKLVMGSQSEYGGKKITMRQTFSNIKPDSFTWAEETSVDGGPMKPSMSIQYTRLTGPKPATAPDTKQ